MRDSGPRKSSPPIRDANAANKPQSASAKRDTLSAVGLKIIAPSCIERDTITVGAPHCIVGFRSYVRRAKPYIHSMLQPCLLPHRRLYMLSRDQVRFLSPFHRLVLDRLLKSVLVQCRLSQSPEHLGMQNGMLRDPLSRSYIYQKTDHSKPLWKLWRSLIIFAPGTKRSGSY